MFASNNDMIDLSSITDMNLDSIMDVLPAGLIKDARAIQVSAKAPFWLPDLTPGG